MQDLNMKLCGLVRKAIVEDNNIRRGVSGECKAGMTWITFSLQFVIAVFTEGFLRCHIPRTLIKRVISICADLRGSLQSSRTCWCVNGQSRVSSGEVSWLSNTRPCRTVYLQYSKATMKTWNRNKCSETPDLDVFLRGKLTEQSSLRLKCNF